MKKNLILFCLIMAVAVCFGASPASAQQFGGVLAFSNMSAATGTVKTSAAYQVSNFKTKSMTITGVTLGSSLSSVTYKNYSGTVIAQCAPTSSGPWSTCNQSQLASTPAVSQANAQSTASTPVLMSWQDAVNYIRLQWTAGTKGGKLKAWLNWLEN